MKRIHVITATFAWMALIFFASSMPGSATGANTPLRVFFLKTLHFMNFGVLALLFLAVLRGNRSLVEIPISFFVISLVLTALYAVSDEYHQKFSPGRRPAVRDVLIDTIGASTFLGTSLVVRSKKGSRKKILPPGRQDTR